MPSHAKPDESANWHASGLEPPARRRLLALWPVWLAVAIGLVSGGLLALGLLQLRAQAIRSGEQLNATLAQVVEEQTSRTIQTIDLKLQLAIVGLARLEASGKLDRDSAVALLRMQLQDLPYVRAMWVTDAGGRTRYDTDTANVGLDFSDRAYFQVHRDNAGSGFHMSPPVRSRTTGTWLISASRPLRSDDGALNGVIVAALEPRYFDQLWGRMASPGGSSVTLLDHDGVLIVRSPIDEGEIGTRPGNMHMVPQLAAAAANGSGHFVGSCSTGDQECRYAFRLLSLPTDMVVVVGRSTSELLGPLRQLAYVAAAIWALSSTSLALLTGFLSRAWRDSLRSEARLQRLTQRIALATEASGIGIWDWDLTTDQWSATPTYFSILGLPPRAGLQPSARNLDHVHPDDRAMVASRMKSVLYLSDDRPFEYEARVRHADGSYRWVSLVGRVLAHDAQGRPTRLLGVRMDINDRKQAENAQQHAKEFAENLIENANAMVVGQDRRGRITLFNQAAQRITGFSADEVLGRSALDLLGMPNRFPAVTDGSRRALDGIGARSHDGVIMTRTGTPRQIAWQNSAIMEDGQIVGVLSFGIDESERRQAEQALRRSEQHLRDLIDGLGPSMFVALLRPDGTVLEASPHAIEDAQLRPEDIIGKRLDETYWYSEPAQLQQTMRSAIDRAASGEATRFETRTRMGPDRYLTIDFSIQPMRDAAGAVAYLVPSARDITDYKLSEAALRTSEERFRQLAENIREVFWLQDPASGEILYVSAAYQIVWGRSCASLYAQPTSWFDALHPQDRPRVSDRLFQRQSAGEYDEEYRIVRPDGTVRWIRDRAFPVLDAQGQVYRMSGIADDITERRESLLALRESEERYRLLVQESPVAIAVHQEGRLIMANPATVALFGAGQADQLIGRPVAALLHPDDAQLAIERLERLFAGETVRLPLEIRYRRIDGSFVHVEASTAVLAYGGRPAAQTIAIDISQRKQAEAALRESTSQLQTLSRRVLEAQETERRRVAHELHDELGQSLTSLKISLQTQQRFGNTLAPESLSEYVAMVEGALQQVRRLALALRPSMLDDLGLVPALRWMAEQMAARSSMQIDFRSALAGSMRLAAEVETACFRIAQEALTNIVRYAQARHVEISVGRDADQLVLTVRDDGRGFDLAAARGRAIAGGSLGVLGMQERAMLIGGTLEIQTRPGDGCTVRMRCPWRLAADS